MAPGQGVEPRFADSKSDVLPLDDPGKGVRYGDRTHIIAVMRAHFAISYQLEEPDHKLLAGAGGIEPPMSRGH